MTKYIQLQFYQGIYLIDLEYVINHWLDAHQQFYDDDGNPCTREIAFNSWLHYSNDAADLVWDMKWEDIKYHLLFLHNEQTYPTMRDQWEKEGNVREVGVRYESEKLEQI